jgi:hypothetical protein
MKTLKIFSVMAVLMLLGYGKAHATLRTVTIVFNSTTCPGPSLTPLCLEVFRWSAGICTLDVSSSVCGGPGVYTLVYDDTNVCLTQLRTWDCDSHSFVIPFNLNIGEPTIVEDDNSYASISYGGSTLITITHK